MSKIDIMMFNNNQTKTSCTIVEFNRIPKHDCDEQLNTIMEGLEAVNQEKSLRETFREDNKTTQFQTLSIRIFNVSTETTKKILKKVITQLNSKPYPSNVHTDIIQIKQ